MTPFLVSATEFSTTIIDTMALIIIVFGTLEAFTAASFFLSPGATPVLSAVTSGCAMRAGSSRRSLFSSPPTSWTPRSRQTGRLNHLNDKGGKSQTINLAIGSRPLFVAGNEGGSGDIAMMRWSKDRAGPSFQLLVNHDDAAREYSYSEPDDYSLKAAGRYGFQVVSMKDDWKTIIAP
jgi:hypothetical protein